MTALEALPDHTPPLCRRVGKTSLRRALTGASFDPLQSSTRGVESEEVELSHIEPDGGLRVEREEVFGGSMKWMKVERTDDDERAVARVVANATRLSDNDSEIQRDVNRQIDEGVSYSDSLMHRLAGGTVVGATAAEAAVVDIHPLPVPSHAAATRPECADQTPHFVDDVEEFSYSNHKDLVSEYLNSDNQDNLIMSLWDFAGQKLFFMMHHLFLTSHGVYLVVFNTQELLRDEGEALVGDHPARTVNPKTREHCLRDILEWLNSIFIFAPKAPVLVIGTCTDMMDDPEKDMKTVCTLIRETVESSPCHCQIIYPDDDGDCCHFVSSAKASGAAEDPSIARLRESISTCANKLVHTQERVPFSWLRLLRMLSNQSGVDTATRVSLAELTEKARAAGLGRVEGVPLEAEVGALLQKLHELGRVLWYDVPGLRDLVVLEPQWVIDHVTCVIRDPVLHHLKGRDAGEMRCKYRSEIDDLYQHAILNGTLLPVFWPELSESERDQMTTLMEQFGLLVRVHTAAAHPKWLVPALLGRKENVSTVDIRTTHVSTFVVHFDIGEVRETPMSLSESKMRFGFLSAGFFHRLLGIAVAYMQTTTGTSSFRRPVLSKNRGQLSFGTTEYWLELDEEYNCVRVSTTSSHPLLVLDRVVMLVNETVTQISSKLDQRLRRRVLLPLNKPAGEYVDFNVLGGAHACGVCDGSLGTTTLVKDAKARDDLQPWFPGLELLDSYELFLSYQATLSVDSKVARVIFDNRQRLVESERAGDFFDAKRLSNHRHTPDSLVEVLSALAISKVAVPVVSLAALGSLAQTEERVDVVLLEWWAMLELHASGKARQVIHPIFVGSTHSAATAIMEDCRSTAATLSASSHTQTFAKLRDFWLEHFKAELTERSPREIATNMLDLLEPKSDKTHAHIPSFLNEGTHFGAEAAKWLTEEVNKTSAIFAGVVPDSDMADLDPGTGPVPKPMKRARIDSPQTTEASVERVISLAVFFSTATVSCQGIWQSLQNELSEFDELISKARVQCALPAGITLNCQTIDNLYHRLAEIEVMRSRNGAHREELVLQFIGHGDDGKLEFEGHRMPSVNTLAEYIARCRPACVIFNACSTSALAEAVHSKCQELKCTTVVSFWKKRVKNDACETLSRRFYSYVRLQRQVHASCDLGPTVYLKALDHAWVSVQGLPSSACLDEFNALAVRPDAVDAIRDAVCKCLRCQGGCADQGSEPGDAARTDVADRGAQYKGVLKTEAEAFPGADSWEIKCWKRYFEGGGIKCIFSHSFNCGAGWSRAYYIECQPNGGSNSDYLVLHVHFWDALPAAEEPGHPNHINLRRAWPVDPAVLVLDPVRDPPDLNMGKNDIHGWKKAMKMLATSNQSKAIRDASVEAFERDQPYFVRIMPLLGLWVECNGAVLTGGATTLRTLGEIGRTGWDFANGQPYPDITTASDNTLTADQLADKKKELKSTHLNAAIPADKMASVLNYVEAERIAHAGFRDDTAVSDDVNGDPVKGPPSWRDWRGDGDSGANSAWLRSANVCGEKMRKLVDAELSESCDDV